LKKNIYIFSGLGADERVFQRLDFLDYPVTYIKWITPIGQETIEKYAARLLNQITTKQPILIGLSFGGLIAIEVAKLIDVEKIILISSIKTVAEIPLYYRLVGHLRLHKLLPVRLLKYSNFITNWFFGTTSTIDKELLRQILRDTEGQFLKWAIEKILLWSNTLHLKNITHIHGTNDRILPIRFISCDFAIKEGGHLMIFSRSDELTEILVKQLRINSHEG